MTASLTRRAALVLPTPTTDAPRGADSRPARPEATPDDPSLGGALTDPALALAAAILDDLEKVRTANANRLATLTRSTEDSDGEIRGFGLDQSHPDVARLAAMVAALEKVEHDAVLNLQRKMRAHPLGPWAKAQKGIGEKQAARLLAVIGDPYIRPELSREDGTVIPEGPRTVSALWAYAGLHVVPAEDPAGGGPGHGASGDHMTAAGVAARRRRNVKANWSTEAKTRTYLIAASCIKQTAGIRSGACLTGDVVDHEPDCDCSPYRAVYDRRRAHTAVTHPDWSDGHSHNDGLRIASKAILRDLWREAKRLHELPADRSSSVAQFRGVGGDHL